MNIALRPAIATDMEFVRGVHHAAFREVIEREFGPGNAAFQDQYFAEAWARGGYSIVLYDGEPCGYFCLDEFPDHVSVRKIVIAPAFQDRGIGTALLRTTIERAAEQGAPVRLRFAPTTERWRCIAGSASRTWVDPRLTCSSSGRGGCQAP